MLETHAFGNFAPSNTRYLILGSFTGKEAVKSSPFYDPAYDWFYGTRGNQFWPFLEEVYGIALRDKETKQALFKRLGIAIADIIHQCARSKGTNLDSNLIEITYNIMPIADILDRHPIEKIFFTSRFVEARFKRNFKDSLHRHPHIELIYLPSPSRRNARMTREEKIRQYKMLLPG